MNKSKIWLRVMIGIALLTLAFVCWKLAREVVSAIRSGRTQERLMESYYAQPAEEVQNEAETQPAEESAVPAGTLPESGKTAEGDTDEEESPKRPREIQKEFLELYETNSDLVGWLRAGEKIDFPVVQRDNEYYLRHNFYDRWDSNGAIFLNMDNCLDPRDDLILIHGHYMLGGRMFGSLENFAKEEYLAQYPLVTFRTIYDEEDVYYTPIAAFSASMKADEEDFFDVKAFTFKDDPDSDPDGEGGRKSSDYREFLDEITDLSEWKAEVDVCEDDSLLALVTCSYDTVDGRFILFCRALRPDETPDDVLALYADKLPQKAQ